MCITPSFGTTAVENQVVHPRNGMRDKTKQPISSDIFSSSSPRDLQHSPKGPRRSTQRCSSRYVVSSTTKQYLDVGSYQSINPRRDAGRETTHSRTDEAPVMHGSMVGRSDAEGHRHAAKSSTSSRHNEGTLHGAVVGAVAVVVSSE